MSVNIKIPDDLAAQIDSVAQDRAEFVEQAVRRFLRQTSSFVSRDEIDRMNQVADELNREAAEVLEFQVIP